jgi:hypothetical protein
LGLLTWLALTAVSSASWAQTDDASRAMARDLATSGVEAFQRGAFPDASAKLEKAYRVLRVPSVGLWSARALVSSGKLVQASERYREVVRLDLLEGDKAVQKQAQADAAKELDELGPRIPRVVIRVEGANADAVKITVDGVGMSSVLVGESRPFDPGKHVIEGSLGPQTVKSELTVLERESKEIALKFDGADAPGAAAPPRSSAPGAAPAGGPGSINLGDWSDHDSAGLGGQKTLALVLGGVGVVGAGVGTFFGLRASSKLNEANEKGCSSACPNAASHYANEAALAAGNVSTVAFVVAGAALAGGAVLWFTAKPRSTKTAQVGVGPAGVQLRTVW